MANHNEWHHHEGNLGLSNMRLKTLPTFTHYPVPNPLSHFFLFFVFAICYSSTPQREQTLNPLTLSAVSLPLTHFMPITKSDQFQFLNIFLISPHSPIWVLMATHSNTLAWKIPWMEEPGRLQFMGSQRVGHDWATSLSLSQPCFQLPRWH